MSIISAVAPFVPGIATLGAGYLGYKGVGDTNTANADIASARNQMEVEEAKKSRSFGAYQSLLNREFMENMSNSAVQRRMADMKKAGINPILAGKYDASTPGGSPATNAKANAHGYTAQNKMQGMLDNLSTAYSVKKLHSEARRASAEADLSEHKASTTAPAAKVADDLTSKYGTAKKAYQRITTDVGKSIGSSAGALHQKTEKFIHDIVQTGKLAKEKYDYGKKMNTWGDPGNIGYEIPMYNQSLER